MNLPQFVATCFTRLGVAHDAPLVAAVSGGPDSMALLDVLASEPAWRKRLSVGHVDHGLREESAAESMFVAEQCRLREVPCFATRLRLPPDEGSNLAARLREARYQFLRSLVPAGGYLLTAHHADDQAMTMLMRFIEGAALPGLRGMRAQRAEIIRPFLFIRRDHLLAWLTARNVAYCSDPSNENTARYRNRVRKEIWPLVLRERPKAAEALALSAQRLQEDDDALSAWAQRLAEGIVWGENWAEIPVEGAAAPPAVLRRLLALTLHTRWGALPPSGTQWNDALTALAMGRRANLPGRVTLEKHAQGLVLLHPAPPAFMAPLDILQVGAYVLPMGILKVEKLSRNVSTRRLAPGDRFHDGKRVVDVLSARGLPRHRRAGYPVITDPVSGTVWSAPGQEPEEIAGVGKFAFTPHSIQGMTGSKVMAPQIVKGVTGAL